MKEVDKLVLQNQRAVKDLQKAEAQNETLLKKMAQREEAVAKMTNMA